MDNPQKSLESLRLRIQQLVQTLDSFRGSLIRKPTELPPWEQLQSHFNVLASTLDSLTSTLHTHFPAHSTSALTSYPLPNFPAQTHEILLTTLLTKKPPADTFDSVWAALRAPDVDPALEELWRKAGEMVSEIQESRAWEDEVVTAEERERGTVREEDWVLTGGEVGEGAEERRKRGEREMETLVGVLRFCATGVALEEQAPLPKRR